MHRRAHPEILTPTDPLRDGDGADLRPTRTAIHTIETGPGSVELGV